MVLKIFHQLKSELSQMGLGTAVGDEGGFAPDLGSNEQAIEITLTVAPDLSTAMVFL